MGDNMIDFDDKDMATIALTVIAVVSVVVLQSDAVPIVSSVVSGIAGFVTGRKLSGR